MAQPENTDEIRPEVPERALLNNTLQKLGHVGIGESSHDSELVPPIDIEIESIEPAQYALAGARPYEGDAKSGTTIYESPNQAKQAIDYLSSLFPSSSFSFIGAGRYGVVLADETGKAFKLYRSALSYSRYEKEAGALKLLSDAGLAPKLHLLVDAGEEYRLDLKAYDYTTFGFEDVQIPRQNSGKELPVMIMDRVETGPIESARPDKLIDGFCKVADVFVRHNIHSWDAEVMVDKASGEVILLDVGELSQKSFDADVETPQAKLRHDTEILRGIIFDFGLSKYGPQVEAVYQQDGLEAVRKFLTQIL